MWEREQLDYAISEKISIGVSADYADDNYSHSSVGLTSARSANLAVELATVFTERTQGRVVRADEEYKPTTSQGREFQKALAKGPKGNEKLFYEWSMTLS